MVSVDSLANSAAVTAHDLKEPLRSITGSIQMLHANVTTFLTEGKTGFYVKVHAQ